MFKSMKQNLNKPEIIKIGLCGLNNDPIDFKRNYHNIL